MSHTPETAPISGPWHSLATLREILDLLEANPHAWVANSDIKYFNFRVDWRDGAFIVMDMAARDGVKRIDPQVMRDAVSSWNAMMSRRHT